MSHFESLDRKTTLDLLRLRVAALAEDQTHLCDTFADTFKLGARRGDAERRRAIAAVERQPEGGFARLGRGSRNRDCCRRPHAPNHDRNPHRATGRCRL
jgi:hypothetical protein